MRRAAGILLPITSLPSKYGIGCFSKEAYEFVDWLKSAGQSLWQILPLGPTGYGDSPYQSFSTFAGNPYMISLEELIEEGILTKEECDSVDFGNKENDIDYEKLYKSRYKLLKKAYERTDITKDEKYHDFVHENNSWLWDYALFMAVKERFGDVSWTEWAEDIRMRYDYSINYYNEELYFEIEFQKYMQYKFYTQWKKLKEYANSKGIKIIGDIPIYVSMDSADVWSQPQLFQLRENNLPVAVAGCPPDGFSADGQLWGNPLYNWNHHRNTGYSWWITRMQHCFKLYDIVRIDHFRGFDGYFSVPYGDKTAVNGHWEKGPGIELFRAIENAIGKKQFIAEDLGYMTDSVRRLVAETGFPNMKVLEFAFDSRDTGSKNDYLPHNYEKNCVAYTGTHDNQTITSWFDTITEEERTAARNYLCDYKTAKKRLNISFIALIMRSAADTCIIPIQDYLGLNDSARINKPSTIGTNWRWRLSKDALNKELNTLIRDMTQRYGRLKE